MKIKSKKIKLTHIICSLGYGGAERFLIDLIKNTDREKYEISVLCVIEGGPLVKELELNEIKIFIIGKKTKLGILTIWKIYKYLKKEKIQIVHTHLFAGDTWGRIAAVLARTSVIISTEHSVNFNEGIIKRSVKKFLSYFTDKIIAISKTVKENSQKRDWINPKKIEVIYNGIDLDKFLKLDSCFHRKDKEKNENDITLGFVGRLEKEKGAECLIEAMELIEKREECHPEFISGSINIFTNKNPSQDKKKNDRFRNKFGMTNFNLKLKILGDGTQRKNLEAMRNQFGLKNKIEFLGFKNNPANFYQQIDILIIPSLWEGLSIVALEAMAVGVPIIASNSGGLREIIKDDSTYGGSTKGGKTGLLFKSRNSKDLAKKILWGIENYDKMNSMAEKAKTKVEDFDIRKKTKGYGRIYDDLLKSNLNRFC
jgi:glycosyltransferase involved in cell wall biosynthesis